MASSAQMQESADIERLLDQAQDAVQAQSWREALALLSQAGLGRAGALGDQLLLLAATCRRHMGDVREARLAYQGILAGCSPQDGLLAEALIGLADCDHLDGRAQDALKLARAARAVPAASEGKLALRAGGMEAHILTHVCVEQGAQEFEALIGACGPPEPTSAWAHTLFGHGDALLACGEYGKALPKFIAAHDLAAEAGAAVTTADSLRRLPLVRILHGQQTYALRGLADLSRAKDLYEIAGDRGRHYIHTEAGEVLRALGRFREAEKEFTRGKMASRELDDANRLAHSLLGLHETSRSAGQRPRHSLITQAEELYGRIGSDWGLVHCAIARGLAEPEKPAGAFDEAQALIEASPLSRFPRERELISRLRHASPALVSAEPHLMNYP